MELVAGFGLWVESSLFPQDLCHPHIADAISEHTENVPHHIRCRRVNDRQPPFLIRVWDVSPVGSVGASKHFAL